MSEFLAEARILVRPDTSRFRADLEKQLQATLARPVRIPVVPVVAPAAFAGAVAGSAAFAAAQETLASATVVSTDALATATTIQRQYAGAVDLSTISTRALVVAEEQQTVAATQSAAATAAAARSQAGLLRGAAASAASLFGIRGATLAASGAFLAGTAAVVAFTKAVQSAATLETELNVFQVNAGATADELERVSVAAKALGRDITLPGVTAGAAATAMTELAKAGLSVKDSMDGARGALQLATAAQIDVSQSSELVANTLNSFGLAGTDAVKVADLLAGAAKSAQGEIGEFGTALGQVSSVADQFGVSAEDTVTLLAQLAKAGLQGGRAGTTLRVAILGLIKPTAAARVELEKLEKAGVEITKPNGAFDPTAFAQINEALKQYSKEQQNVIRNTIFSSDAIKVLGRATAGGVEDFNAMNDAVSEAGLSLESSAARTKGLQGDIGALSNQFDALGLTIGEAASGPLSVFLRTATQTLTQVNNIADGMTVLTRRTVDLGHAAADAVPPLGFLGDHLDDIGKAALFINPTTRALQLTSIAMDKLGLSTDETSKKGEIFAAVQANIKGILDGLIDSLDGAAAKLRAVQPADTGLNVKQIQNVVGGFDAEEVRARIAGDNAQLLDVLNTEQAFLERQLTRDFVKNRPALKRALEQSLLGVVNDISSIQDKAIAEQQRLKRERDQAAEDLIREQAARAKALIDLRNSSLNLAIQEAGLTESKADDRRAINKAIKVFQDDIKAIKKIKDLTVEQKQKVVDLRSAIAGLKASLQGLKDTNTQGGGFSIGDFFKEAVANFETFGGNIAGRTGVLSPQDARAQVGGSVLAQLGSAQLTEAQKQTILLESINSNTSAGRTGSGKRSSSKASGAAGDWQGFANSFVAANNGYGSF